MTRRFDILFLSAVAALGAAAAPILKPQPELVADGALRIKPLANAAGVPAPTPQARFWRVTRGGETTVEKRYDENEVSYAKEIVATWKDKKGNVMRLAKPEKYPWGEGVEFKREVTLKNGEKYYIDFEFAEPVTSAQAEKLLKDAASSLSDRTGGMSANNSSMKWWRKANELYEFNTDLDKAKGGKFIADAMRLMDAMSKSYRFYVPPTNRVGICKVRVFKTLAGYREYRASTGDEDTMSCGLWDPSREELLIAAENREQAQNTMRHEAFHQYLHYATGRGDHAIWFNEGHAAFFENVKYNPAKNTVAVIDEGNRPEWVARNPELHARHMKRIIAMTQPEYYSGDVNLNYCTGWALAYFLEKGAYAAAEFAPWRKVVPEYLAQMAAGADPRMATERAFAKAAGRDLEHDFLKFWNKYRKQARNAR